MFSYLLYYFRHWSTIKNFLNKPSWVIRWTRYNVWETNMTFDLKLWPMNLNINRHQIITEEGLSCTRFEASETMNFLSYPFRNDLWPWPDDMNITRDQHCNKDYLPTTFKASEANRSSNLLVYLLHNARVYVQADIHTHRPTYQPTDKNVQSGMPSFFETPREGPGG